MQPLQTSSASFASSNNILGQLDYIYECNLTWLSVFASSLFFQEPFHQVRLRRFNSYGIPIYQPFAFTAHAEGRRRLGMCTSKDCSFSIEGKKEKWELSNVGEQGAIRSGFADAFAVSARHGILGANLHDWTIYGRNLATPQDISSFRATVKKRDLYQNTAIVSHVFYWAVVELVPHTQYDQKFAEFLVLRIWYRAAKDMLPYDGINQFAAYSKIESYYECQEFQLSIDYQLLQDIIHRSWESINVHPPTIEFRSFKLRQENQAEIV
jgi:hypothetical protein